MPRGQKRFHPYFIIPYRLLPLSTPTQSSFQIKNYIFICITSFSIVLYYAMLMRDLLCDIYLENAAKYLTMSTTRCTTKITILFRTNHLEDDVFFWFIVFSTYEVIKYITYDINAFALRSINEVLCTAFSSRSSSYLQKSFHGATFV